MEESAFFKQWLRGKYLMPDLDDFKTFQPDLDFLIWVAVNHKIPFHKILEHKILGLDEAWMRCREYYRNAINLVVEYSPYMALDHEEGLEIIDTLGDPPDVSHPLYIITVDDGTTEEIVYVGKSSSNHSRFKGGHTTAIKLLDPNYDGKLKWIYLCQVMLNATNDEYLPLEFLGDKTLAEDILDDAESVLIDDYKPVLNTKKMDRLKVKRNFTIQIQKSFADSTAIQDKFIFART
ncbi:hypothetical protein WAE58_04290 [Pedobacter panaciterrae]|uniref:GIY-YIG domain-containing protein n=1 Tax=Pedobacter panaciterrae TaxID=363849 RepID=A0ABU8NHA6_9SPHI